MSENPKPGMTSIVKTVSHWVRGFILLFGIYIVLYGHLTPGGGFAGGVIMASAFILIMLAEGQAASDRHLKRGVAAELDSVGALIFLVVAILGVHLGGVFFSNFITTGPDSQFKLFSAGIIPICNIGIGIKVGASLFLVFAMLSALHVAVRKDGKRQITRRRGGDE